MSKVNLSENLQMFNSFLSDVRREGREEGKDIVINKLRRVVENGTKGIDLDVEDSYVNDLVRLSLDIIKKSKREPHFEDELYKCYHAGLEIR